MPETTNTDQLTEAVTAQWKVSLSVIPNIPHDSTLAHNLQLANFTPTITNYIFYCTLIVLHIYNERKTAKKQEEF